MKTYIVHVQIHDEEQQVPVMAASLDAANEWAVERYENAGFVVNRVRQKV